jgi:hypothetical protein
MKVMSRVLESVFFHRRKFSGVAELKRKRLQRCPSCDAASAQLHPAHERSSVLKVTAYLKSQSGSPEYHRSHQQSKNEINDHSLASSVRVRCETCARLSRPPEALRRQL